MLSLVVWTISEEAWRAMASPVARDALLLSMKTTAISMFIIVVVGTPAAYVLARADFRGKRLVDALVDIPAVLPPSAAGIALLLAFGRFGLVGEYFDVFGVTISFTTAAVVMAEIFVAAHFYVRQASIGFRRGETRRGGGRDGGRGGTVLRLHQGHRAPGVPALWSLGRSRRGRGRWASSGQPSSSPAASGA